MDIVGIIITFIILFSFSILCGWGLFNIVYYLPRIYKLLLKEKKLTIALVAPEPKEKKRGSKK